MKRNTFLNNSTFNPSRSRASLMRDDRPFEVALNGVQSLTTKLKQMIESKQMSGLKQDPNYLAGTDVLEQCAVRMIKLYENKPGNDDTLDDASPSVDFGRQSMA